MGTVLRCNRCESVHDIEEITPNVCPSCRLYGHLQAVDEDACISDLVSKLRRFPSIGNVEVITARDVEAMSEQGR